MRALLVFVALAAFGGLAYAATRREGATGGVWTFAPAPPAPAPAGDWGPAPDWGFGAFEPAPAPAAAPAGDWGPEPEWGNPFAQAAEYVAASLGQVFTMTAPQGYEQANEQAFLRAVIAAEGTDRDGGDPYRVVFGYGHTIQDLSDHPAVTGEWRGAAFGNGLWSTAAGAYQQIKPTWLEAKAGAGLVDFSPASQDAAALWLIRRRGALADVRAGRFAEAVNKCRKEWASLPGAGYGQGERTLAWLTAKYQQAGGQLA